jgi:hypothetical protein
VSRGSQTAYTVTVTRSGGFTGAIALGVTGQQTSDTATFSPNPIGSGANSATLTVKTNKLDSRTTRTLTITGTGSGKTHTATVSLTYR